MHAIRNTLLAASAVLLCAAAVPAVGTRGALLAANANQIGSPGAVPEPGTYALLLAGLGAIAVVARGRIFA